MKNNCITCDQLFDPKPGTYGLYCSISCSNIDRQRKNEIKYMENPKRCYCGNPIPYKKRDTNIYCSSSCATKITNKKRPQSVHDKQRKTLLNTLGIDYYEKTEFEIYKKQCRFNFSIREHFDKIPGTKLILETGVLHFIEVPNGWTRDHMYSIFDGYKNNIDPELIKHPANCEIMLRFNNAAKSIKSSITIEELQIRIQNW